MLSQGVFGQFLLYIRRAPAHVLVAFAWLSVRCGGVRVLSGIPPPSSPYSGEEGPPLNSFSIELTVQCDWCLICGLGSGVCGLGSWLGCRLGRLMGCSTDLGLGCWFQSPDP